MHEHRPINCKNHLHQIHYGNHVNCPAVLLIDECEQNETHLAAKPVYVWLSPFLSVQCEKAFLEKQLKKKKNNFGGRK